MTTKRNLALASAGLLFTLVQPHAHASEVMTQQAVRDGYKKHAALTQLHRWYQFYENTAVPIENQLDILSQDVHLKSALGEGVGHAVYRERVAKIPTTWGNAHRVNSAQVTVGDDGTTALAAAITYWNTGILDNGTVRRAELSYTTTLEPSGKGVLPTFTSIQIDQDSDGTAAEFVDLYPENRLKSLMHYWLTLIEDPARNPEPVREILTDEFTLKFSSGAITDFDQFKAWLAGPASQVAASTHMPELFSYQVVADGRYAMNVEFAWRGILPDGKDMTARTRHSWKVVDDPKDRFAKIELMEVKIVEPFAVVSN